jgi:outer membrane biosynthesis protein TonB
MSGKWWLPWAFVAVGCASSNAPSRGDGTPATRIAGRLEPGLIQKIVRAAFGEFRVCYEQGLSRDQTLTGTVEVRFVIGRVGKVTNAAVGSGTTIPDRRVAECVVTAFYGLEFPEPNGGIVSVAYPIMLSPG